VQTRCPKLGRCAEWRQVPEGTGVVALLRACGPVRGGVRAYRAGRPLTRFV